MQLKSKLTCFLIFILAFYFLPPKLERFKHNISAKYVDYSEFEKVEEELSNSNLIKADELTAKIIFKVTGREKSQILGKSQVQNIPCQHLLKLDDIWKRKSKNKHGFTSQQIIFKSNLVDTDIKQSEQKFRDIVGWNQNHQPSGKDNLERKGYFPYRIYKYSFAVPLFSAKLANCHQEYVDTL